MATSACPVSAGTTLVSLRPSYRPALAQRGRQGRHTCQHALGAPNSSYFGLLLLRGVDDGGATDLRNFSALAVKRPAADLIPDDVLYEQDPPVEAQGEFIKELDVLQHIVIRIAAKSIRGGEHRLQPLQMSTQYFTRLPRLLFFLCFYLVTFERGTVVSTAQGRTWKLKDNSSQMYKWQSGVSKDSCGLKAVLITHDVRLPYTGLSTLLNAGPLGTSY